MKLIGDVRIGAGTVVHPRCEINAAAGTAHTQKHRVTHSAGPIVIGEHNVIEECVVIRSRCEPHPLLARASGASPSPSRNHSTAEGIKIGSNNIFEVGAQVLCPVVGDANVIEARGAH